MEATIEMPINAFLNSNQPSDELFGDSISCLFFNNGLRLSLAPNDIVVFVGSNNVGKSQALRDIYESLYSARNTVVVKNVRMNKRITNISEFFDLHAKKVFDKGVNCYCGIGFKIEDFRLGYNRSTPGVNWGELRPCFASFLGTEERLSICKPPEVLNPNEPPTHPIHYVAYNKERAALMNECFKKAFEIDIIPNTLYGKKLPLSIGNQIKTPELDSDSDSCSSIIDEYRKVINSYPVVDSQGDGIKSYVGILLNLIVEFRRIFIIDEPESFLHPPQARTMGHTIGELLNDNQQCFISTHSSDIIRGLLETCPDRVKLVRITRDGDTNSFSVLNNTELATLWEDPILKYSELMTGIFHKNVVICESDSDCKFYSIVDEYLKGCKNQYSQSLFVHSGGKQRLFYFVKIIRALNVPFSVIPDIDILKDKNDFGKLVEASGGDMSLFEKDYKIVESNLFSNKKAIHRSELKVEIEKVLSSSSSKDVSDSELREIAQKVKKENVWDAIKKGGIEAAPRGDGYNALNRIINNAKKLGIFIVPVGELENFVKSVGGHGTEWVNNVIASLPNFEAEEYKSAIEFVKTWNS